jgi:hypothetical protein
MNAITREQVIEDAYNLINFRDNTYLRSKLKEDAEEYGREQQLVNEVNHWLDNLLENLPATIQEFNNSFFDLLP